MERFVSFQKPVPPTFWKLLVTTCVFQHKKCEITSCSFINFYKGDNLNKVTFAFMVDESLIQKRLLLKGKNLLSREQIEFAL